MLADRVILGCTVIVAVIYLYATAQIPVLEIGDPLGPKAFPRLLGVALLIGAGVLGLELWRDKSKKAARPEQPPAPPAFEWRVVSVLAAVALWTGGYYLAFEPLGYVLATTIYLVGLTAWFNRGRWVANLVSAVSFVLITYFLFVKLEVRLPPGLLPL